MDHRDDGRGLRGWRSLTRGKGAWEYGGLFPTARARRRGSVRNALDDRDEDVAHEVGGAIDGGGGSGVTPPEIAERISVSALMLFIL